MVVYREDSLPIVSRKTETKRRKALRLGVRSSNPLIGNPPIDTVRIIGGAC
jgi:hypothetical protein